MDVVNIKSKISPILNKYGIVYAAIFGSVSRGESNEKSDVDILVRLGKPLSMFTYMSLINSLESSLGRKVDLVTENSLNKFVRPYVIPELKTIYEK